MLQPLFIPKEWDKKQAKDMRIRWDTCMLVLSGVKPAKIINLVNCARL